VPQENKIYTKNNIPDPKWCNNCRWPILCGL